MRGYGPANVYLYASDHMSQLPGNGLPAFVARSVDKLGFFWRHDEQRISMAEAGRLAAQSMFAFHRIAKYILEASFTQPLSEI